MNDGSHFKYMQWIVVGLQNFGNQLFNSLTAGARLARLLISSIFLHTHHLTTIAFDYLPLN